MSVVVGNYHTYSEETPYYAIHIHIIYPTKPNNGIRFMKTDEAFLSCPIVLSRFRAWRPPPCPGRSRGTPAGKVHGLWYIWPPSLLHALPCAGPDYWLCLYTGSCQRIPAYRQSRSKYAPRQGAGSELGVHVRVQFASAGNELKVDRIPPPRHPT